MNGQAKTADRTRLAIYNAMVLRPPFSGVEHAVLEQARALLHTRSRHRVTVLWPRTLDTEPVVEPGEGSGLRVCGPRWSSRALRILWEQLALPGLLRRSGAGWLHAPAYLAPLAAPCPVVLNVYDLHALDTPERCRPLNRWNFRLLLPASIRRARRILVPSDYTARAVARRFPSVSGRIRHIPLGIAPRFRPGSDCPATLSRPNGEPPYLLSVGNIEARKNLPVAVEALRSLRARGFPGLRLVVAGRATTGGDALREAVRNLGLEDAVELRGYVRDDELPALYSRAAAFVYPSVDEGFGLPPLEAMACGCPVVCSRATALCETVGDAALLFGPDSPDELAVALRSVLGDAQARHAWIARGTAHAAAFSWPRLAERVLAVYDEL